MLANRVPASNESSNQFIAPPPDDRSVIFGDDSEMPFAPLVVVLFAVVVALLAVDTGEVGAKVAWASAVSGFDGVVTGTAGARFGFGIRVGMGAVIGVSR